MTRWSVIQWCWNGALYLHHVIVAQFVQRICGDAGLYIGCDVVEYFGGQPAGRAHGCDVRLILDDDAHGGKLSQFMGVIAGSACAVLRCIEADAICRKDQVAIIGRRDVFYNQNFSLAVQGFVWRRCLAPL